MKLRSPELYEARAKIAKALAHPTRLLMLDALQQGELCVCEMTDIAGVDQSTVSKHLAILKDAGLVGLRKHKSSSYYRITCTCLDGFFGCIESVLRKNLEVQRELVRA